ncbi:hypothetical protein POM88_003959 [Heracleum sosnowskyi]|uniref:Uncharacterized protein n=1 Tax=Heracleum sosnowskyi TaxID=360622 RepID=A0AAD8JIX8_9APIA|nr:hypothetical protein POM88_003959 [Heracleum sosnowskyi]
MGGPQFTVPGRTISQAAFEETVRENIEDLGMDPTEALLDAIETLTLQGVDLSGIVTCAPGSGNADIATRNGGLELVCEICSRVPSGCGRGLVSGLNALASLLHDLQCTEIFRNRNGPEVVVRILNYGNDNVKVMNSGFSVIAAAATGNEVL